MSRPIGHKNARGFWLTVCLIAATVAGYVMRGLGIVP